MNLSKNLFNFFLNRDAKTSVSPSLVRDHFFYHPNSIIYKILDFSIRSFLFFSVSLLILSLTYTILQFFHLRCEIEIKIIVVCSYKYAFT